MSNAETVSLDDVFSAEIFGDVDFNSIFQEAMYGVLDDKELAFDQKVLHIEHIVQEASSDFYQEFVDVQRMAAQIEMFCNHDHELGNILTANETIYDFMHDHVGHDSGDRTHTRSKKKQDAGAASKKSRRIRVAKSAKEIWATLLGRAARQ